MSDGLARPISFEARYGAGLGRTVCLGGGGLYFVAWQIGYLHGVTAAGIDLRRADRVVGTSAGSIVSVALTAGKIGRVHTQLTALGRFPAVLRAMAPASSLRDSQLRAVTAFREAEDAEPETIKHIGRAALAAVTPEPVRIRTNLGVILQVTSWPGPALYITTVDAYTGERCVITSAAGIHPARATAASSAVPGVFPPQAIGDRKCMDGGVSGTGLHLDLVAGAERVVALSLVDGSDPQDRGMTNRPGGVVQDFAALEESGTRVFRRSPGVVDEELLMSAEHVPAAMAAGAIQAAADLPALRQFWG